MVYYQSVMPQNAQYVSGYNGYGFHRGHVVEKQFQCWSCHQNFPLTDMMKWGIKEQFNLCPRCYALVSKFVEEVKEDLRNGTAR